MKFGICRAKKDFWNITLSLGIQSWDAAGAMSVQPEFRIVVSQDLSQIVRLLADNRLDSGRGSADQGP